ncbi:MAG TPA: hypothetical protein VEY87_02460 [Gaiellaceae bacterium]|nr:hypothetical protein [Gaiellaceae bacterium]
MAELPRTEDLPRSEDGFDPGRVEEAFTEFGERVRELESIAAELRAELRALREERPVSFGDEDWPDEVYDSPPADWVAWIPPPFARSLAFPRIAFEVAFLLVVALLAGLADLETRWIVLVMASAWVLVAASEWAAAAKRARWRLEEVPAAVGTAEPGESTGPWSMPVVEATVVEPPDGSDAHTMIGAIAPGDAAVVVAAPAVEPANEAPLEAVRIQDVAEVPLDDVAGRAAAPAELEGDAVAVEDVPAELAEVEPAPPFESRPPEVAHGQLGEEPAAAAAGEETPAGEVGADSLDAAEPPPGLPEDHVPADDVQSPDLPPPADKGMPDADSTPELPPEDDVAEVVPAVDLPAAEPEPDSADVPGDEITDDDVLATVAGADGGAAAPAPADDAAPEPVQAELRRRWGFGRRRRTSEAADAGPELPTEGEPGEDVPAIELPVAEPEQGRADVPGAEITGDDAVAAAEDHGTDGEGAEAATEEEAAPDQEPVAVEDAPRRRWGFSRRRSSEAADESEADTPENGATTGS